MRDNLDYWIDRHKKHFNRLVSVGDIQRSEEENIRLYAEKKRKLFDILRKLNINDLRGRSVLDAGCGIGLMSELFWIMGAEVAGVDGSEEAICQAAWRVPSGRFTSISLSEIRYEQNFDIVFCIDVLYHIISDEAWKQALSSLCNCLYSGGLLIIIEQLKAEQETPASHVHFRTLPMYLSIMRNLNMSVIDIDEPKERILIFRK